MEVRQKLIFDIGMHKGEDTVYYLAHGYEVLAIEANPRLADQGKEKFKDAIADGRLTILNVGVSNKPGILPFYINKFTTEWSSFDKEIGIRNSPEAEIVEVPCVTTKSLFEKYGIPYYIKIDIEGYDYFCLNDIPDSGEKPPYVSCEAVHVEWLDILMQKGYTKFKMINQADGFYPINLKKEKNRYYPMYRHIRDGLELRARKLFKFKHLRSSSGPFGENTKGEWRTYEEIRKIYIDYHQGDLKKAVNDVSWWDFHAAV
jgi:FkbM family methyltransferase